MAGQAVKAVAKTAKVYVFPDTNYFLHYIYIQGSEPEDTYFQGLDRQLPDDRIIVSALNFAASISEPVVLITGDTNVRVKARARRLEAPVIPEAWQLSEEQDDLEREVAKLKQQVTALEQREPQLDVTLVIKGKAGGSTAMQRRAVREPTFQEYEQRSRALLAKQPVDPVASFMRMQNRREGLRTAIQEEARWRTYLKNVYDYEDARARSCDLIPKVVNTGATSAEGIAIEIMFPTIFTVGERTDLPSWP